MTAADETASPTAVATERVTGLRSRIDPARLRAWLLEMTRFLIVGGASFVVDLGLYNLLVFGPGQLLGHKPITAKVIATAIATLASWLGNRNWTFADQRTDRRGRELLIYGALNVVGALVPIGTLAFSRYVLHLAGPLEDNIATILGIAAATILRYVGYKLWVFTGKSEASRAAEPTPAS